MLSSGTLWQSTGIAGNVHVLFTAPHTPEVASTTSGDALEELSLSDAVRTLILVRPEVGRAKERRPPAKK